MPVKQAIRHSLFQWIPYFGGPVTPLDNVDPYAFRSTMGLSTVVCFDLRRNDLDLDLLRKLMTEWQAVADGFYGDYYPLTPYSRDEQQWMAWQFHRPAADDGLLQVFRRPESPFEVATFTLRGLDPSATYRFHDYDTPADVDHRGAEWQIELPYRRSARYHPLPTGLVSTVTSMGSSWYHRSPVASRTLAIVTLATALARAAPSRRTCST